MSKVGDIYIPAGDKFKKLCDFHHLIGGKGLTRLQYIELCQRMGIDDICDCDNPRARIREDSGKPGQVECAVCQGILTPLAYLYPCDECMEPILPDHFPVMADETLLCSDCI